MFDSFFPQRIFAGSQLCESIFLFPYPYSLSPTHNDYDYTVPTNWVAGCGYCYLLPNSCRLRAKWQIRPTHSVSTLLCLWLQFAPHSMFSCSPSTSLSFVLGDTSLCDLRSFTFPFRAQTRHAFWSFSFSQIKNHRLSKVSRVLRIL